MTFFSDYIQELVTQLDLTVLHLEEVIIGIRYTAVKIESPKKSYLGVSFTLANFESHSKRDPHGKFHEKTISELINNIDSEDSVKRSVAIATLNAIAEIQQQEGSKSSIRDFVENNVTDSYLDSILHEESVKIGMIGQIKPVIKLLQQNNINITILDKFNPVIENKNKNVIPAKNIFDLRNMNHIIVTGSSLVFPNFEEIVKEILPSIPGFKALIGPSASVYPYYFFNSGFNVIASSTPIEKHFSDIINIIKSGGGFYIFRKYFKKYTVTK